MKLPLSEILGPLLKPNLWRSQELCYPLISFGIYYVYFYGFIGLFISFYHLRSNIGKIPSGIIGTDIKTQNHYMMIHDISIITSSTGFAQYLCLVIGCCTFSTTTTIEQCEGTRIQMRALLAALLGISMSVCAFASQPVELELNDDDVAQRLSNVSFARRLTKPTIRFVMGYGKLSAFTTAATSLLLLVAVMSKSWRRRGARWLAAPALLVAALEATSDAGDAMLAAALRGSEGPVRVFMQTAAAAVMITIEILVWYFIAKFFEYNPSDILDAEKMREIELRSSSHESVRNFTCNRDAVGTQIVRDKNL